MNAPIVRLYAFFALLFGVLVFATSWWSVFEAEDLRENTANRRPLLAEERIKRGTIRSADGKVLARSVKIDEERYARRYPTDETVRPRDRLLVHQARALRARGVPQRPADRAAAPS